MNKPLVGALTIITLVLAGGYFYWSTMLTKKQAAVADYKNISYTIEGQPVQLVDGKADVETAPGSASHTVTTFFGNIGKGDLNGDSIPDLAFLLTQTSGGSGTFYYVVAALQNADGGYTGTNGVLLGDRIAPQTTEIQNGQVIVNYADRQPGEPMTAQPSVGVTKVLKVSGTELVDQKPQGKLSAGATDMGTYVYECDEHVMFTVTPADEMTSIKISPVVGAAYPPELTLLPMATPAGKKGKWFGDDKYIFTGEGESVTLAKEGDSLNCSPVSDPNNAPWNWGD